MPTGPFRVWNLEANGWLPPTVSGDLSLYGSKRCKVTGNLLTIFQEGVHFTNSFVLTAAGPVEKVIWNKFGTHLLSIGLPESDVTKSSLECWAITNALKVAVLPLLAETGHLAIIGGRLLRPFVAGRTPQGLEFEDEKCHFFTSG